ncbi:hypothetical protein [Herbiconiux sp.]|uniref:hypothetical protein n=1 Tax=Herbiconiux sp. TaxID=1871186 RepID=UPI0025C2EEEE|nr:hypothetical protein [Herbiconiux sp.]
MAQWHPVDSLLPAELIFPRPGTKEPYAIIRWVDVMLEGEPVSRWRVVTWHSDPNRRRLLSDGYYRELEDAAMAAHRHAVANAGSNIIQTRGASVDMSPEKAIYR